MNEDLIKWDFCDDAIIGMCETWDGNEKVGRLIYDYQLLIDVFVNDGMTLDQAVEWIDFNLEGAYVGKNTPIIMHEND